MRADISVEGEAAPESNGTVLIKIKKALENRKNHKIIENGKKIF